MHVELRNCFLIVTSVTVLLLLPVVRAVDKSIVFLSKAGILYFHRQIAFIDTHVITFKG